jgi:hypothetical protein
MDSISVLSAHRPIATRQHDVFIMDIALATMLLKPRELQDINLVRIYLKITTVSDLANVLGNLIERSVWDVLPFTNRESLQLASPNNYYH